ncbi:MAG: hypothetical protein AAB436_01195 [Patescibacteria group bacterium]
MKIKKLFNKNWLMLAIGLALPFVSLLAILTPQTAYAEESNNILLLVGQHCHGLKNLSHEFKVNSGNGTKSMCDYPGGDRDWQEVLNKELGCTNKLYYQHSFHTDPNDDSVVTKKWYTKEGSYKDCYARALAQYNAIADPKGKCAKAKDGSDNNKACEKMEDHLHNALGCSDRMFKKTGDYWSPQPGVLTNCKTQIDRVGAVHIVIIGPDGKAIANPDAISSAAVAATDAGGTSGGGTTKDPSIGCEVGVSTVLNPLNWLLCGAILGLNAVITQLDNAITSQLSVGTKGNSDNPNEIFTDDSGHCTAGNACKAYHAAWLSFRNIALGLMVIAGLIVLIAQALGMEILDAYTIRKVLPRLLIAALAITLSWELMRFFVTFTNDLGYGIRYLIYHPFVTNGVGHVSIDLNNPQEFISVLLGSIALLAFGSFGVLTFVGAGALAVLVAFVVLMLRQILIIMLIIMAPLGIVAYILPNTQRFYKMWWETFSKALLMFPLIAAIIATGHVFSAIAAQNKSNVLSQIIAFVTYFLPYFIIPMTFRYAGGMMSGMANAVNSRAQPGFAFLQKRRGENTQRRIARARAGKLWNSEFGRFGPVPESRFIPKRFHGKQTGIGQFGSRVAEWGLDADEMVPGALGVAGVPGFKRFAAKAENQIDNAAIDHSVKAYQEIENKGGMHREGWRALSGSYQGYNETTTQRLMDAGFIDKDTGVTRAVGSLGDVDKLTEILAQGGAKEQLGAQGLRTARGTLATINGDPEMFRADIQTMGALGLSAGGWADQEDLTAIGNSIAAGHGKLKSRGTAYAQRVVKKASDINSGKRPETRFGHGVMIDEKTGKYYSVFDENHYTGKVAKDNIMSIKNSDWSSSKSEGVKAAHKSLAHFASEVDPATGKLSTDASSIRDIIRYNAGPHSYGDPGAKAEWLKIADELNIMSEIPRADSQDPNDLAHLNALKKAPEPKPTDPVQPPM